MTGVFEAFKYIQSGRTACLARAEETKCYCFQLLTHQISRPWNGLKSYLTEVIISIYYSVPYYIKEQNLTCMIERRKMHYPT